MARTHLTLAALVSSALDGFSPAASRDYAAEIHDDVDAAVIEDISGTGIIVEVPRTGSADAELRSESQALSALTAGVKSLLPFTVPAKVGQVRVGDGTALLTSFIPGVILSPTMLAARPSLCASTGRAIASIHDLPSAILANTELVAGSALDARVAVRDIVSRARNTTMLPAPLAERWEAAVDDDGLWQFEPAVIHGSLTMDAILVVDEGVSGIVGWHALRVGDPARDLSWLANVDEGPRSLILSEYSATRRARMDSNILRRANLYGETDVARWLLHGIDKKSPAIIDDAVDMLSSLLAVIAAQPDEGIAEPMAPVLDASEVATMLDENPVYRPSGTSRD